MLAGFIRYDGIACQFLYLLWAVKTSNVAHFSNESDHGFQSYTLDIKQLIDIWDLCDLLIDQLHQLCLSRGVHLIVAKECFDLISCRF